VPKDNPFVALKGARPEIWAYGLRQPWRMSFDRATGDLWVGEVGQDLWEGVLRIEKGGNYSWSVTEGSHPFRPERKRGPTPILPPVVEHPHSDFRSLTGGFVYRGRRLPELTGTYLYGDWVTRRIWGLRYERATKQVTCHRELATTPHRIVSWGEDRDGEVYFLDFVDGQVHRLVKAPEETVPVPFPRKLSETGLFASVKDHEPAAGLVPYEVNAPLWGDHTTKERFLALPGSSQIEFDAITYPQPSPGAPPGWRFPDGTVLVKTFSLEMEAGNSASRRRLETRLLHFRQLPGPQNVGGQYWKGYTYLWNEEQTDADLLDAAGLDRTITVKDARAPSGQRVQTYRFPSRAECTLCHTAAAKFALGVNTLQLNRDRDYGGGRVLNQLRALEQMGVFTAPLPAPPKRLPRLVNYEDDKADLNLRARAYLHANCAHCHLKWGGGNAEFNLLATLDLKDTGLLTLRPTHGTFRLDGARLLAPGAPERSLLWHRLALTGLGRMPPVGSGVVDARAVQLLHDWIKQLPGAQSGGLP
jgi:uncharacterized repeat protein (TIGR03806 family)